MSIQAINQVYFGNKDSKSNKTTNIAIGTGVGLIGGATIGYFLGEKISAERILGLDEDTFAKTFANMPEEHKEAPEFFKKFRQQIANDEPEATELANTLTDGNNETSIENYLKNASDGEFTTIEDAEKIIKADAAETENLKIAYRKAEEVFKNADDVSKDEAKQALKNAKKELSDNLWAVREGQRQKEILESAVNGNISRDTIKASAIKAFQDIRTNAINEALALLGDATPKVNSFKKAGIYGAIAAILIGGAVAIFSGSDKVNKKA